MNFRPTQVKWQLMVASCYRRSGMNLTIIIRLTTSCRLSAFKHHDLYFSFVFRELSEGT